MTAVATCRVLVVDDSDDMLYLTRLHLSTPAIDLRQASAGAAALDLYAAKRPDVVVLDLVLDGEDGLDVAEAILATDPSAVIVLFSEFLDGAAVARAAALGIRECLSKDHFQRLAEVVRRHCASA